MAVGWRIDATGLQIEVGIAGNLMVVARLTRTGLFHTQLTSHVAQLSSHGSPRYSLHYDHHSHHPASGMSSWFTCTIRPFDWTRC